MPLSERLLVLLQHLHCAVTDQAELPVHGMLAVQE
jgi:hypothetical protein